MSSSTRSQKRRVAAQGHEVTGSDLYAMNFDPVTDRKIFTTTSNASYYKQQVEETYASE